MRGGWAERLLALLCAAATAACTTAAPPPGPASGAQPIPTFASPAGAPACRGVDGYAADFGGRRTFTWRPEGLLASRSRLTQPAVAEAHAALIERADAALAGPSYTVVDKSRPPPSGDRHDYAILGVYWWPNPAKRDGLPYVRRDGVVNPERNGPAYDASDMSAMSTAVESLALAHFFTDERRYADKAAQLLRVWFLDPSTRMNPRLNFAQGVPGLHQGRAAGLLDTHRLLRVVESVGLLAPSGALSEAEQAALRSWFGDYVEWLLTSELGREEGAATNNHGLWYAYQVAAFALFAGKDAIARTTLASAPRRLAQQIAPDGSLPEELGRTRSLHYTAFALAAAANLAELGRCVGLDLWAVQTPDGRGLRRAVDYVGAYAGREQAWPHSERNREFGPELYEVLSLAARRFPDGAYAAQAAAIAPRYTATNLALRLGPP